MPSFLVTGLSTRDQAVIETVRRHGQATAGQLQRLHFADGSEASRGPRTRRTLARLTAAGHLLRLVRPLGGFGGGSGAYVYLPPSSRARAADPHRLAVTELHVRLVEWARTDAGELTDFQAEPECHRQVGRVVIKPDGWLRLATGGRGRQVFIELDRGTESGPEIARKLAVYTTAHEAWTEPVFPLVLFVAWHELPEREQQRQAFLERLIQHHPSRNHFHTAVCGFDQAIPTLVQPEPGENTHVRTA
jgi:Replication-relaxation